MSKGYALIFGTVLLISICVLKMILFVFSFAAADVPHDCAISAAMLAVVLLLKESMDADVDEKISHFYQQWLSEGIECVVCYFVIQLVFLQQYFPIPMPYNITRYHVLEVYSTTIGTFYSANICISHMC